MTVEQMTARINELYHKSQTEGLSAAEKEEQKQLRMAYVANVRASLRGQLDNISILEKDGMVTNLGEKKQSASLSKAEIRSRTLKRRDGLSAQERARYSGEIVKKLTGLPCYREAEAVLTYAAYRSEVETSGLIRQALADGRQVFVPRVEGERMEFWKIEALTDLQSGYRGIPEPVPGIPYPEWLSEKDEAPRVLLCLPGAAFDRSRRRIGYGGGFFDRYLQGMAEAPQRQRLTTAALAYACQVWDEIPQEPHDIAPDILLTEEDIMN